MLLYHFARLRDHFIYFPWADIEDYYIRWLIWSNFSTVYMDAKGAEWNEDRIQGEELSAEHISMLSSFQPLLIPGTIALLHILSSIKSGTRCQTFVFEQSFHQHHRFLQLWPSRAWWSFKEEHLLPAFIQI